METLFILGNEGGGTSATAGSFVLNGWGSRSNYPADFEDRGYLRFMNPETTRGPDVLLTRIRQQQMWVRRQGCERYVTKVAGLAIYGADMLHKLSPEIAVLLVWRDPAENFRSITRRFPQPHYDITLEYCEEAQAHIESLHKKYNWPMFRFHNHVTHKELEDVSGYELPYTHIDHTKIGKRYAIRKDF